MHFWLRSRDPGHRPESPPPTLSAAAPTGSELRQPLISQTIARFGPRRLVWTFIYSMTFQGTKDLQEVNDAAQDAEVDRIKYGR